MFICWSSLLLRHKANQNPSITFNDSFIRRHNDIYPPPPISLSLSLSLSYFSFYDHFNPLEKKMFPLVAWLSRTQYNQAKECQCLLLVQNVFKTLNVFVVHATLLSVLLLTYPLCILKYVWDFKDHVSLLIVSCLKICSLPRSFSFFVYYRINWNLRVFGYSDFI